MFKKKMNGSIIEWAWLACMRVIYPIPRELDKLKVKKKMICTGMVIVMQE